MQASPLANFQATVEQLETSGSQLDGIPVDLEESIRFAGARLTQAAGVLLRLPQEVIAQAIILFTRFWIGPEGGSLAEFGAAHISAGSLYLAAKLSAFPKSARSIVNVYAFLDTIPSTYADLEQLWRENNPEEYYVSPGTYERRRSTLFNMEKQILKVLGFQLQVTLPYTLAITYLQALSAFDDPGATDLAKRTFAHLNSALLSPQLLLLTHQPPTLATAAIYLAAKETNVKLPGVDWWTIFDTDREELGFLVVGLLSVETFATAEKAKWADRKVPLTVEEVNAEMDRRQSENAGE
ncbi:cyclin-L2 [Aaosphaeria arxii CBS 175.79]|uniref:Cyclin-L2 n=1 Tax=Aaosphaeria arxii CBS 175.79 TaxID=1450172 RepID=A0A6A5XTI8_9PLEO|nr:cyclin-L2 [Aaosphaeria arxii CBS 175.79]KAF2016229.1 cyclin-L2 [Aaosphaeria arxii CBS 175.79]